MTFNSFEEIKEPMLAYLSSWRRVSPWAMVLTQASRRESRCWAAVSKARSAASNVSGASSQGSALNSSTHLSN